MIRSVNRGKLDAVRLLELLAMLGRQQRSGSLTLKSAGEMVSLSIVSGSVRSVSTYDSALRIGQVLIQLELITEEQIEQALALQSIATDPERIGEVLVDVGYITAADVGTAMATQIASALGILLNEDNPVFEFTPWNQPQAGVIQPEIEYDPLVLTVIFLAEYWLAHSGQARSRVSRGALHKFGDVDLDPDRHPVHQRLYRICEAVGTLLSEAGNQEAERVSRSLTVVIDYLRSHGTSDDSSRAGSAAQSVQAAYQVRLVDQTTDVWSLTDLTRPARSLLLHLLNGEERLDVLLAELRPHTSQPDRAVRELSSAGLVQIIPDDERNSDDATPLASHPDRTVILRFLR